METKKPNRLVRSVKFSLGFIVVIWCVHLFQFVSTIDLGFLGVRPRVLYGLRGILFSPLIHGDFQHLISNSAPMIVLMTMIKFFYPRVAWRSFIMVYVLSGLAVWLLARPVFHIGASGVVYGLVSFVFWSGIFRRNIKSVVLALIVTFLYSGILAGVVPGQEGISWESHLLGGFVGIFVAYWYKEEIEKDEKPQPLPDWKLQEENPLDRPFFLDKDVFNKTKEQRRIEEEQALQLERQRKMLEHQARLAEQQRRKDQDSSWFSSNTWED